MINWGEVPAGSVLPFFFDSFAGSTGASVTLTGLAVTDIEVYKGTSMTQRSSDNGYSLIDTDGIDIDGITGIHGFSIDLSDNSDASFYTVGSFFTVVVSSVTIDSQTVSFVAGTFRIKAAEATAGYPVVTHKVGTGTGELTIASGVVDAKLADAVAHGGTLGSSTATLALSRLSVVSQSANTNAITATGNGTGHGAALTSGSGATGNGLTLLAASTNGHGLKSTGTGTGDGAELTAGASGTDLDADVTGAFTGSLSGSVGSVTGAVGSVTGNVGGNVTGSVGSVAGAVGSVTGNVGGNVVGSVASVTANVNADVVKISGSTAAADNLEESTEAIVYGTAAALGSTTTVIASSTTPASTVDDQFNGRVLIFKSDTSTAALQGQATTISDYVHATKTFTVVALTTAPAAGDTFVIL